MGKRVQKLALKNLASKVLNLGYVGENEHTQIVIDCSEVLWDYENAVTSVVVQPPRGDMYPVEVTREDDSIIWEIADSDLVYSGTGRVQITFTNDGEVVKSAIGNTKIDPSIMATGTAPTPLENWMERAEETARQMGQDVADATLEDLAETKEECIAEIEQAGADTRATIPADYTQMSDDVSSLKSALSANKIDTTVTTTFIDGKTLESTTGAITDYNGRSVSEEIKVNDATSLQISNSNGNMRSVVFYDTNHNWVQGISQGYLGDGSYPINSGATYMRYCAITDGISSIDLVLVNASTVISKVYDSIDRRAAAYTWQSQKYVSDKTPIQNISGVIKFPNNLIVLEDCVDNEYVVYNTGIFRTGDAYFRTGYLPVVAGTTYKSNAGRNAAWYTSAKEYISGVSGTSIKTGIVAPQNAAYLIFNVNKSSDNMSNPIDLYCASIENYGNTKTKVNDLAEWCTGKTINWIGDSIVDGNDFDEEVCTALGLVKMTTDGEGGDGGINGSTIAMRGDGTNTRHALCLRYADMQNNVDIVAVSAGTNDWMYAWCPIGTINDPDDGTSNTTFYGALKTLCKGLIDKYPQKVIFFTTPIKRGQAFGSGNGGEYTADGVPTTPFSKNKYGKTLGDYADIIKEVCGYYSIPVLDMYRESLLNPHLTSQQDMFDSVLTHPNTTGQKIMARRVCGWLTQLGYIISGLS